MNPLWKQANPKDQLTVILMGLEGHIDNTDDVKLILKCIPFIDQLKELGQHLKENWE